MNPAEPNSETQVSAAPVNEPAPDAPASTDPASKKIPIAIPSTEATYISIKHCELCGRKVWKGYFLMAADEVQSMIIRLVCWRCKLHGKKSR